MISFNHKGDFKSFDSLVDSASKKRYLGILSRYGQEGVSALSGATPVDTGKTAGEWTYEVNTTRDGFKIEWKNGNVVDGIPVAILIQYGHASKNGGFVSGIDFINPAIRPLFKKIADKVWEEVVR